MLNKKNDSPQKFEMHRRSFHSNELKLSYLDSENDGAVLLAFHAHFMEANTYRPLAKALAPNWRVIALDQRGHGYSGHAATYTRTDYINDVLNFLDYLKLDQVVILGHSLGGVNAFQFAARYPNRVRALIIEDIVPNLNVNVNFIESWDGIFSTKEELINKIGSHMYPSLQDSIRETAEGWRLVFDIKDMIASCMAVNGDHWKDWISSTCSALMIRGKNSRLTTAAEVEEMIARRPNTELQILEAGHSVHLDQPEKFIAIIRTFLEKNFYE